MDSFRGKVAVITGAAKGIGFALARRACEEGMSVVLADIDKDGLEVAAHSLADTGAHILAEVVDVGDRCSMANLAQASYERFSSVHLLCNNAGIVTAEDMTEYAWAIPSESWQRTINVNLWGAINGCLSFGPRMIEQGDQCHILNTASTAGLTDGSAVYAVYRMTKFAIVALSESLSKQFADAGSNIKVSVLCPYFVATAIADSALSGWQPRDPEREHKARKIKAAIESGVDPADIAAAAFRALKADWFYIVPDVQSREGVQARFEAIMTAYNQQHS